MENSTIGSLYRKKQTFQSIMQWASAKTVIDSIDLNNTTVGVCQTEYSAAKIAPEVQGNAAQFFRELFKHANASCVEFGCHITGADCGRPPGVFEIKKRRPDPDAALNEYNYFCSKVI